MRKTFTPLVFLIATFGVVVSVSAQSPNSYVLRIFPAGSGTAVNTNTVTPAELSCDQPTPTNTTNVNPTRWYWNDPAVAGRVCIYVNALQFENLADGQYEGTAQYVDNAGLESLESTRAAFSRQRPPTLQPCTDGTNEYPIGYTPYNLTVKKQEITSTDSLMASRGWTRTALQQLQGNNYRLTYRCDGR